MILLDINTPQSCMDCELFVICKNYSRGKNANCPIKGEAMISKPEPMTIKIKYFDPDIKPVKEITNGDWLDLRAAEDIHMEKGEYKLIPLGVAMELPKGYEALVAPRSGTFGKYGILCANSIGIIDESYCGDGDQWHFPAYAVRGTFIKKNDRICQFRIIKHQEEIELQTVLELKHSNRGGFGSTGKD